MNEHTRLSKATFIRIFKELFRSDRLNEKTKFEALKNTSHLTNVIGAHSNINKQLIHKIFISTNSFTKISYHVSKIQKKKM